MLGDRTGIRDDCSFSAVVNSRSVDMHIAADVARLPSLKSVLTNALLSRLLIVIGMFAVAPHLSLPRPEHPGFQPSVSWTAMTYWDGKWYERIVTEGYEYQPDGREHNIAFFPLYPILVWIVMRTGLGFAAAGTLVNNLAFLGVLYILYQRTAEHYGQTAAHWAVAALAWFPLSIFCFVTYSEAVFLVVTLAFLQTFEKRYYWAAGLFAGLAAISRVPGITIVPTVVVFAAWEKLAWRAYLPAMFASLSLAGFMGYQLAHFQDPLAFVHASLVWQHVPLSEVMFRILHPINLMRVLAWPAAFLLFWSLRRELCRLDLLYAAFSLLLILVSRNIHSVHRLVFGIVPVFLAIGLWFSKRPYAGTVWIFVSAVGLLFESVVWAWDHFIG